MATAVQAHSVNIVRQGDAGKSLSSITSLPELAEMQLFLTSEIEMSVILPLLQHPV